MSARIKLAVAVIACLVLWAVVMVRPLGVRVRVIAYDGASTEDLALREVLSERPEEFVPTLIDRALSPDCRSRQRIVALLGELAPIESYDAFAKALKEYRPRRRVCAAQALGLLANPAGMNLLRDTLRSDDPAVREAAVQALRPTESISE